MIIFLEQRSDGTHTVLPWSWTRDFKLKVRFSKSLAFTWTWGYMMHRLN